MHTITETLKVGGETFRLRWDMHAVSQFERLTGENAMIGIVVNVTNLLTVLWAAVDADAASRDEDAPITLRKFGTLFDDEEKMAEAFRVASRIISANNPEPQQDTKARKEGGSRTRPRAAARKAKKDSRSGAATSSRRSTSASASASSGA